MASFSEYVSVTTTAGDITLEGQGEVLCIKSLDGAGIVAARVDGTAADASGSTAEGQHWLAATPGDTVYIDVASKTRDGAITISLDATATTKVACWLESRGILG